jgi:hypothetical protein
MFAEDLKKTRKMNKEYRDSLPRATQTLEERNNIQIHAAVWEQWTGSRFIRMENPIQKMTELEFMRSHWSKENEKRIPANQGYTARSCPVTGDYKKV